MKHNCLLLILPVWLVCLASCKKDGAAPQAKVTVVGKWYVEQHNLKLVKNGVQLGETIKTDYTKDDFTQFFEDGTGYLSATATSAGASLSTFHYTLTGTTITLFVSGSPGIAETITKLTETEFSVHYESQILDPNGSGVVETEIDDYQFKK